MGEGDETRLIAWSNEMRAVHGRLREALRVSQEAVAAGEEPDAASRDLLLFCHGFCTALSGHHRGEDAVLFPELAARHPELRPALAKLKQDHSMIEYLVTDLLAAVERRAELAELDQHLEGIAAIMESHFGYEERELLSVLENFELDASVSDAFGPL